MSQSGTLALAAAIGAAARLVIRGVWTWKAVATGAASVVVAFALASLTVHYAGLEAASSEVKHAVYTIFGVIVLQILERIEHIDIRAKFGGFEVTSKDDDT